MPYFYHPESSSVWEEAEHCGDGLVVEIDYEQYVSFKKELDPMSEVDSVRLHALTLASQSGSTATATDLIITRALAFHAFLTGAPASELPKPRGRKPAAEATDKPTTAESPAADAPATSSASTEKTAAVTASTQPSSSDDDFLSESPPAAKEPEKTYELKDVRAALVDLQTKVDKDTAMKVLKDAGGAETLGGLKPERFAAVIAGALVAVKKAGK